MLKDMEYVYAVYLEKSFSKAAVKLFVSQPALSTTIKKVEAKIGLPLFDRSSTPIRLTHAGEYYIKSIEQVMEIQQDMELYFSSLLGEKKGTINVGSATFFCAHILPTIIQEFQKKYPGYKINLLEANANDMTKCLQSGVLDLSLDVDTLDTKTFNVRVWGKEHIILAVPAPYEINNRLKEYRITFEDLCSNRYLDPKYPKVNLKCFENEPFLFLKKGNDMYRRGFKMCKNAGFTPKPIMYLDQLLTSYYIACDGKGIAFVRAGIANYVEPTNKLFFYKIDDENSVRNIMLYYKKSAYLSKAAKDFIEFLNDKRTDISKAL